MRTCRRSTVCSTRFASCLVLNGFDSGSSAAPGFYLRDAATGEPVRGRSARARRPRRRRVVSRRCASRRVLRSRTRGSRSCASPRTSTIRTRSRSGTRARTLQIGYVPRDVAPESRRRAGGVAVAGRRWAARADRAGRRVDRNSAVKLLRVAGPGSLRGRVRRSRRDRLDGAGTQLRVRVQPLVRRSRRRRCSSASTSAPRSRQCAASAARPAARHEAAAGRCARPRSPGVPALQLAAGPARPSRTRRRRAEYTMAFVRVPELSVSARRSAMSARARRVRFRLRLVHGGPRVDADGFVVRYPGLADRVQLMAYEFKLPDLGEGLTEGESRAGSSPRARRSPRTSRSSRSRRTRRRSRSRRLPRASSRASSSPRARSSRSGRCSS